MVYEQVTAAKARAPLWLLVVLWLLLAACTMPQEEPLPDGVTDQRADLVERIKDNPTDMDAHADLLRMQIKSGDKVGAESTVAHAIKNNSKDFRAHLLEAQFHRWQLDLITTEKALLKARVIAPDRLEPCVALAGLYNQTYLEAEELKLREVAFSLATPDLKPEFALDLAYCHWQRLDAVNAGKYANGLGTDKANAAGLRARTCLLLAEVAMQGQEWPVACAKLNEAFALTPEDVAVLQFAARAATVVEGPAALKGVFEQTLVGKDRAELRWTALFGLWTLALREAALAKIDPLSEPVDAWRKRLEAMEPGHPDVAGRYYQLLKLDPDRAAEAEKLGKDLEEYGMGIPPVPSRLEALLSLWRIEDAFRVGRYSVKDVQTLRQQEGNLEGTRMLLVMAMFKSRQDTQCLAEIDTWLAESKETDDILLSLRWWVMLRQGRSVEVLTDIQKRGGDNNSRQWLEAVAKFHTYRAAARKGE